MNQNKFKVCLLNDSFPPTIDGVANTVVNYANTIQQHYGDPIVVTPKYPGVLDNYPYPVLRYASLPTQKMLGYRAGYPLTCKTFHNVEKQNIDIIHSHCPFVSGMVARSLQRACDVPLVFTYHTKFDYDIKKLVGPKFLQNMSISLIVDNITACDEVWVVSEGAGENLRSLGYKGDYRLMENGVDFPVGKAPADQIDKVIKKYKLNMGVARFFFAGRMRWYKGIDVILKSLKRIKELGYDFQMVFAGNGLDFEEIKKMVEDFGLNNNCVFTGAITDRDELRALFSACDLFLFPSLFDTNGIVVREAAACAVPTILIANSCAAEGIVDMDTGFLIENSVKSMVAKLEMLLKEPQLLKKVGEIAQSKIYLSWEDSIARAVERYHILIDNHKSKTFKKTGQGSDKFYNFVDSMYDFRKNFYKK